LRGKYPHENQHLNGEDLFAWAFCSSSQASSPSCQRDYRWCAGLRHARGIGVIISTVVMNQRARAIGHGVETVLLALEAAEGLYEYSGRGRYSSSRTRPWILTCSTKEIETWPVVVEMASNWDVCWATKAS
jgi:hypothetical protein